MVTVYPKKFTYTRVTMAKPGEYIGTRLEEKEETVIAYWNIVMARNEGLLVTFYGVNSLGDIVQVRSVDRVLLIDEGARIEG